MLDVDVGRVLRALLDAHGLLELAVVDAVVDELGGLDLLGRGVGHRRTRARPWPARPCAALRGLRGGLAAALAGASAASAAEAGEAQAITAPATGAKRNGRASTWRGPFCLGDLAKGADCGRSGRRLRRPAYPPLPWRRECITAQRRGLSKKRRRRRRQRRRCGAARSQDGARNSGSWRGRGARRRAGSAPSRRVSRGVEDRRSLPRPRPRSGERVDDRPDLVRMDAPHARVAELARPRASPPRRCASRSVNSVTTQCDGVLARPWQAAAISSLARTHERMAELARRRSSPTPGSRRGAPRRNPSARTRATRCADARRARRPRAARRGSRPARAAGSASSRRRRRSPRPRASTSATPLDLRQHQVGEPRRRRGRRWSRRRRRTQGGRPGGRARRRGRARWRATSAARRPARACSASPPTGAPSSQSSVTSKTGPSSACSARLLRIRASTPA